MAVARALGLEQFNLLGVANRGIKTTAAVGVTGGTDLAYHHQQTVAVAIYPKIDQSLGVAAALALDPKRLSRAGPIGDAPAVQRLANRVLVHPSHHQNLS